MYNVKNIDHADYKNYTYMVIRDCNNEEAPNDGYWYWGSYNDLMTAYNEANSLCNGLLVETKDVVSVGIR